MKMFFGESVGNYFINSCSGEVKVGYQFFFNKVSKIQIVI